MKKSEDSNVLSQFGDIVFQVSAMGLYGKKRFNRRKSFMRRLTPLTLVWRNFLYANPDGYHNDSEELLSRVSLIQDEREMILNQMLGDKPDMNEIQMSKEEITFQIKNLEDMVEEFIQFSERYQFYETPEELQDMILNDLLKEGMESEFYIVAQDWKEYAANADQIIKGFKESFDSVWNVEAEQYLLEQMLELQNPKGRENLQIVKAKLDELKRSPKDICRNKTDRSIIQSRDGIPPADSKDGLTEPAMTAVQPNGSARKIPSQRRI